MDFGVVTTNEGNVESQDLYRELRRRGHAAGMFCLADLRVTVDGAVTYHVGSPGDGNALTDARGLLVRGVGAADVNFSQIFFRMDCLYALEATGTVVINGPAGIEMATDKFRTSVLLKQAGIPTPRTVVAESFENALAAYEALGGDVVLKPIYGSMGYGITRLADRGFAEYVFSSLDQLNETFYLQEFLSHQHRDIRVFVLDGQVVASMVRESPTTGDRERDKYAWKTNIHAGARPKAFDPPAEICEMSIRAAGVVSCPVAGVDVLETERGYQVIEVNSIPGWRALQRVVDVDVPARIVDYLERETRR